MGMDNQGEIMFQFKLPSYSEWKESVEKFNADIKKFWKDYFQDLQKHLDK